MGKSRVVKQLIRILALCACVGGLIGLPGLALARQSVDAVRVWQSPEGMRLVFDLTGSVEHNLFLLENPHRVVVDVEDTLRTRALFGVDVKGTFVDGVRSAERNQHDLRIVLDLNRKVSAKSFLLKPNDQYGYRLVVDLDDAQQAVAEPVRTLKDPGTGRDIVIAIDPGHGGEDPGAVGPKGTYEKHVVLAIARKLRDVINAKSGYKAYLTRDKDYFLPLRKRREIAREQFKADLFVSIHADAFTDRRVRGASVFTLSRRGASSTLASFLAEKENQSDMIGGVPLNDKDDMLASVLADLAMEGSMEHSRKVGRVVLSEVGRVARLHKREIEQAGFAVLKSPDIPSILVETGFISNPDEERKLTTRSYQASLAKSIGQGVFGYFDRHPPPGSAIALAQQEAGTYHQHTIASGETLSQIAARYNISLTQIRRANALSDLDLIKVGQTLRIPKS